MIFSLLCRNTCRYLLDLELAKQADCDANLQQWVSTWNSSTLVEGRYTAASDLYHLGIMLQPYDRLVTSTQGKNFLCLVTMPPKDQEESAQSLLEHPWLGCIGAHCRMAGAQAGES